MFIEYLNSSDALRSMSCLRNDVFSNSNVSQKDNWASRKGFCNNFLRNLKRFLLYRRCLYARMVLVCREQCCIPCSKQSPTH